MTKSFSLLTNFILKKSSLKSKSDKRFNFPQIFKIKSRNLRTFPSLCFQTNILFLNSYPYFSLQPKDKLDVFQPPCFVFPDKERNKSKWSSFVTFERRDVRFHSVFVRQSRHQTINLCTNFQFQLEPTRKLIVRKCQTINVVAFHFRGMFFENAAGDDGILQAANEHVKHPPLTFH